MKKIKIRWIIEIVIIILFIFTYMYSYIKSDDYDSKARNYKSYSENNSEEGFLVEIIQDRYYDKKACIRITVKYNNEMTNYWETEVTTKNKLIRDENFNVEFCGDYVKINVIDKKGKIVGIFRAYKNLEDISSQSDAEEN